MYEFKFTMKSYDEEDEMNKVLLETNKLINGYCADQPQLTLAVRA